MTASELQALIRGLAPAIREYVDRRLDERLGTTSSSEPMTLGFHRATCATEGKPHLRHCGDWDPSRVYSAGDGILFHGKSYRATSASKGAEPIAHDGFWEPLP